MDQETLHRFFAGTASRKEEEAVCDWAEASDAHRAELIRRRKQYDLLLLGEWEQRPAEQTRYRTGRVKRPGRILQVAAVVAALVVSALYLYDRSRMPENPQLALNRVTVPPGQRVNLTLSDGTEVWLNACSELSYPSDLSTGTRRVTLKGEAYFEVTKRDGQQPFVVQAGPCDVKVLGTKFNVHTDEAEGTFRAALLEGIIELASHDTKTTPVRLSPMQQASWEGGTIRVDTIRDLDDFRWREGLICFDHIIFADLMKRFEKTYDIRIEIQSDRLRNLKCSGKCRVSDGIEFILQVLQQSIPFSFTRSEDHSVIYIR